MKLYLVSKPHIINENISSFLDDEKVFWQRSSEHTNPEALIELSARICKMSFGQKQKTLSNKDFIYELLSKGHESVLEHSTWTFIATGVTRAFSHQLVRHRIGFSFSQLSQQYVSHDPIDFLEHPLLKEDEGLRIEIEQALKNAKKAYSKIIKICRDNMLKTKDKTDQNIELEKKRLANSIARTILPNCTETKILFSANARAIRHFLKIRGNIIGDIEMRIFCQFLLQIMSKEAPHVFSDFRIETLEDGFPIVRISKQLANQKIQNR